MKLVTYFFGDTIDPKLIVNWVNHYQKSGTTLPACLLYQKVDKSILSLWPYNKLEIKENIKINIDNPEFIHIHNYLISDIFKMLAYKYFGDCIVMDIDSMIKKKITLDMIPECDWGLVKKRKNASYCNESFGQSKNFTIFDEFDIVDDCFCGLQIVRKNFYPQFIEFFNKYLDQIDKLYLPAIYGEAITCLTHAYCKGTFLQPEWNWMFDNRNVNNDIIIEHYCSTLGKKLLLCKNFYLPEITILQRKYV